MLTVPPASTATERAKLRRMGARAVEKAKQLDEVMARSRCRVGGMPLSRAVFYAKSGKVVDAYCDAHIAVWERCIKKWREIYTVSVRETADLPPRRPGEMLPDIYRPPETWFMDTVSQDKLYGLMRTELDELPEGIPVKPPVTLKQLKEERAEMERKARGEYRIKRHRPSEGIEDELKRLEEKLKEEQRQKEPDDHPPPRPPTPPLPEGDAACARDGPRAALAAYVARAHLVKNGELYDASGNAVDYLEEAHVVCYFSEEHPEACRYMVRDGELKPSYAAEVAVEDLERLCEEADADITDVICHVGHEALRHRPWQSGVTRNTPHRIPAFGAVRACSTPELLGILGLEGTKDS